MTYYLRELIKEKYFSKEATTLQNFFKNLQYAY